MALSPNEKIVASGSEDGVVRLWDVETSKVKAKWTGHSHTVWSVCWSKDGQRAISGSSDGTARLWDVGSGKTILGPINLGHQSLLTLIHSPDETKIATGGRGQGRRDDELLKIWDSKTFEFITTLKGHVGDVVCLAWTTDGKTLISGSNDGSIRTWDTTTWQQSVFFTDNNDAFSAIAISPNNRILASATAYRTVRLWNFANGRTINSSLRPTSQVVCLSFSPDGKLLATGCNGGGTYTWNLSAIIKDDGFDDLVSDSDDLAKKAVLHADATRLTKPLDNSRVLSRGFFDDMGDPTHASSTPHSPAHQSRPRVLLDRFSSFFRRPRPAVRDATANSTPKPFRPLNWTRVIFSRPRLKRDQPDTELLGRQPPEVEVPYTRGLARNVRVKRKSEKKVPAPKNIMNIRVAGTSQPPDGGTVQQSGATQDQPSSSQPPVLLTTTPAAGSGGSATTANMSSTGTPDVVIRQPGYWTRFWLSLGCISTENAANPL